MKNRIDALAIFPSPPPRAANEDFVPPAVPESVSGWDAYEVWRTRIKVLQDQPNHTTQPR
jgi:hypothetical protein